MRWSRGRLATCGEVHGGLLVHPGGNTETMRYGQGFKARMVQRMAGPRGVSANSLAEEMGVSQATLSRWLRTARTVDLMSTDKSGKWTPAGKLPVIVEASQLDAKELGAFLCKEGLHEATLREWHEAATASLSAPKKSSRAKKSPEAKQIQELERDLRRKEKAMAEIAAIITLQQNVREIWGGARTAPRSRGTSHDRRAHPGNDGRRCTPRSGVQRHGVRRSSPTTLASEQGR